MIENDDGGCKAGLSRLAEFPWSKKPTDESANRGGSAGGYLPGSPPERAIAMTDSYIQIIASAAASPADPIIFRLL